MLMNNYLKTAVGLSFTAIIAACSMSTQLDAEIEHEIKAATELKEQSKVPTQAAPEDVVRVKNDIWLGDKSEIEYNGEPLPSYLEAKDGITLVSNRPITLFEVADMINKLTSIQVRFANHLEEAVLSKASENKPDPNKINTDWAEPDKMLLSYKGPLSGLLNEISSRFGIWWKYEKNQIFFFKYETRTFTVYSLPTKPSLQVNMGGESSGESGNASATLTSGAELELWSNIEKAIQSMIGEQSKLSVDSVNGTVTLTGTPIEIKKVAKYINEQNMRLSRQVAISVKILQVTVSDSDQYGLDLSAGFDDGKTKLSISSPSGLSDEITKNINMTIAPGNWSVSSFMQALSEKNNTTLVTSGTVTTLNNKPAPIQVTRKENYISEITKTNSGSSDTGTDYDISTETEEIETGFTLNVLPRIMEHGRLLMMFNLTLSDLISLEKVYLQTNEDPTEPASGEYIQNPIVETRGFTQEVALKSGESLILSGYERVENEAKKTGVGSADNSLLGGTAVATKDRSLLVIILTPIVLESPLNPESRMKTY